MRKMRKNKIIAVLVCGLLLASNTFGQSKQTATVPASEEEKIVNAMLLYHLWYSLAVVNHYKSNIVVEREYNTVFNKIDVKRLQDNDLLHAYSNLLGTLKDLQLNDKARVFLQQQALKEKKEAVYKTLQNTALSTIYGIQQIGTGVAELAASAGAASTGVGAVPGAALGADGTAKIVQGATGLVYSGVSAYFNYRNAVNSVENQLNKDLFNLNQSDFNLTESFAAKIWETSVKIINGYAIPKEYIITREQFVKLAELLDTADADSKIILLEPLKDTFSVFTPYWYELGCAYQEKHRYAKAIECYEKFEEQKRKYSILDNDTYYTELAKNMISLIQEGKSDKDIKSYISIIEKDTSVATEPENKLYLAQVYASLNDKQNTLRCLEWIIANGKESAAAARDFYEFTVSKGNQNFTYAFVLNQLKIAAADLKAPCCQGQHNKYIKDSNLAFVLPEAAGSGFKLDIIDNNTFYDSVKISSNGNIFYFVNRDEEDWLTKDFKKGTRKVNGDELEEKAKDLKIVLTDDKANQFVFDYNVSLFDAKPVDESFGHFNAVNKKQLDDSDLEQIDIATYIKSWNDRKNDIEKIKDNDNDDEKNFKETQNASIAADCYEKASSAFLKNEPYLYRNDIVRHKGIIANTLISYGVQSIEVKNSRYSVSKYGDLQYEKEAKNVDSSRRNLYKKAIRGDADAMFQYGYQFLTGVGGDGTEFDFIEALRWFRLAANKKNANAYMQLGDCFKKGTKVAKNEDRAFYYYALAANLGNADAKAILSSSSRPFVFYNTEVSYDANNALLPSSEGNITAPVQTKLFMNLMINPIGAGSLEPNAMMPAKIVVSSSNPNVLIQSEAAVSLAAMKTSNEGSATVFESSINPAVAKGMARFKLFSEKPCTVAVKIIYADSNNVTVGDPAEVSWTIQFK